MGLGKWIALGVGIAAAPYTGGASLALGSQVFNSLNNKEAADKAVGQQQAATDRALAANDRTLGGYIGRGNTAGDALQGLMGLGPLPGSDGMAAPADVAEMGHLPADPVSGSRPRNGAPVEGTAVPRATAPPVQAPATLATLGSQSGYGMAGGGGASVRMRGPNGQLYDVPTARVSEAEAQGGQRVQ